MNRLSRALPVSIAFLLVSLGASAQTGVPKKADLLRSFISNDDTSYLALLAPVPAAGSAELAADWKETFAQQASRTDLECRVADGEDPISPDSYFLDPAYDFLDAKTKKQLYPFFARLVIDSGSVASHLKKVYQRERPFVQDSDVHPCIKKPPGTSYPSGHSTTGMVVAYAMLDLFSSETPSRREAILARGELFGQNRVMAGVHFASDVAMGRVEASAIIAEMRKSAFYQKTLSALRSNIRR